MHPVTAAPPTPRAAPLAHDVAPGVVVWITGLSGAGKTTTAAALAASMRRDGETVLVLDGDEVRATTGHDLGHSRDDRIANAHRLVNLAALAARNGVTTIVATMSLYREIHERVRAAAPRVCVVYLHAPLDLLAQRDTKRLYADARTGRRDHVVGVQLAYDPPPRPDLTIDVAIEQDLTANVGRIRSALAHITPGVSQ